MKFLISVVLFWVCWLVSGKSVEDMTSTQAHHSDASILVDITSSDLHKRGGVLFWKGTPLTGTLVDYYKDGKLKMYKSYVNGLQHGPTLAWYQNGMPVYIRTYRLGEKSGVHTGWWENGQVKFEYHFSAGLHEGLASEWFEDGTLFREFHYRDGKEEGRQRMWFEDGSLRANYIVKKGRRYGLMGSKPCSNPSILTIEQ